MRSRLLTHAAKPIRLSLEISDDLIGERSGRGWMNTIERGAGWSRVAGWLKNEVDKARAESDTFGYRLITNAVVYSPAQRLPPQMARFIKCA